MPSHSHSMRESATYDELDHRHRHLVACIRSLTAEITALQASLERTDVALDALGEQLGLVRRDHISLGARVDVLEATVGEILADHHDRIVRIERLLLIGPALPWAARA